MNDILSAALSYAAKGVHVFPQDRSKKPCIAAWPAAATTAPGMVRSWWDEFPDANVAAVLGPSNLLVIDVDMHGADGFARLADLEDEHGPLPSTLTSRTGGGGEHRYFRPPASCRYVNFGGGVELAAGRRAITLPPSVHATGAVYQWTDRAPLAELPPTWAALMAPPAPRRPAAPPATAPDGGTAYGVSALARELAVVRCAGSGTRNCVLARSAFNLGQLCAGGELEESHAVAALIAAGLVCGLPEREVLEVVHRCVRSGMGSPRAPERVHA